MYVLQSVLSQVTFFCCHVALFSLLFFIFSSPSLSLSFHLSLSLSLTLTVLAESGSRLRWQSLWAAVCRLYFVYAVHPQHLNKGFTIPTIDQLYNLITPSITLVINIRSSNWRQINTHIKHMWQQKIWHVFCQQDNQNQIYTFMPSDIALIIYESNLDQHITGLWNSARSLIDSRHNFVRL